MTARQNPSPLDNEQTPPPASRKRLIVVLGVGALILFVGALALFQPWLLFVNNEINDEIPSIAAPQNTASPERSQSAETEQLTELTPQSSTDSPAGDSAPVALAQGVFISHEHDTSGTATVFRLPDGSHQLALEGLETTTGPDVHVWLSQAPVIEGPDGWFTAGSYDHLDLGVLKGNRGNQVYDIPAHTHISDWTSLTLWCEAFSVSFGAAELASLS